ncbi:hypothetical protein GCM10010412_022930 [Nonomuraea recticatena]|uniref:Thioester reductase (TE) domain-containing protein n=1 Tax=Nonomuraea recticatena TaxID=46178 RepID=A0ABN3RJS1_9ACTN
MPLPNGARGDLDQQLVTERLVDVEPKKPLVELCRLERKVHSVIHAAAYTRKRIFPESGSVHSWSRISVSFLAA